MRIITVVLILSVIVSCKTNHEPEKLSDYISCIKKMEPYKTASEYTLDQFQKYDYIILTERSHAEKTQYDLFLEIINSEYFITNVGTIFTEVGSVSCSEKIKRFLLTEFTSDSLRNETLLELYKDLTYSPIWEKYNFYYFLDSLNKINSTLPDSLKIELYTSDIRFPGWANIKNALDYRNMLQNVPSSSRDSVMAQNIFSVIDSGRSKALVIMNYRHGFGHNIKTIANGDTIEMPCVGKLMKDKYGKRAASFLINSMAYLPYENLDSYDSETPIHQGKWDATFKYLNIDNIGFSFLDTKFGNDTLDIWPYFQDTLKYEDVFDGYLFYKPLNQQIFIDGIPNIMTNEFTKELERRTVIVQSVWNYDDSGIKSNIKEEIDYLKDTSVYYYENIDKKMELINNWLK
jgi:hypothetical protein